jgi:hypothetical protein
MQITFRNRPGNLSLGVKFFWAMELETQPQSMIYTTPLALSGAR